MVLRVNGSALYYSRQGSGEKKLLLFHGFGQDHQVFESLAREVSSLYTCYIFDLYFHGQSTWAREEEPLEKEEWQTIVTAFLQQERIERFSLLGFSLGAKLALATAEAFPEKTAELFLLAPDGIKTSFWYNMATYPTLLRKFFKSMILHPQRFFSLTQTLHKLKLVDAGLLRFAEHQMNTEEKRKRVYYSWVVFRRLRFDLKKIAQALHEHDIDVTILVGKYDKVIRPEAMKKFLQHLKKHRFEILETGHNGVILASLNSLRKQDR
jgi:pimeloyl-ACP methyl ester carboxylesterase